MEDLNVIDLLVDAIKMHKKVSKHSLNLLCQIIMLVYIAYKIFLEGLWRHQMHQWRPFSVDRVVWSFGFIPDFNFWVFWSLDPQVSGFMGLSSLLSGR